MCTCNLGQEELNKHITSSKPTMCLLDPVPTKLLKELSVAEEPLLNINSSLSLGHIPKPFKLAVIKPFIKKPQLDPSELGITDPFQFSCFMAKYAPSCEKIQSIKYFRQVSGPTIAHKLHLLKLQMTRFLRQTKAASHC